MMKKILLVFLIFALAVFALALPAWAQEDAAEEPEAPAPAVVEGADREWNAGKGDLVFTLNVDTVMEVRLNNVPVEKNFTVSGGNTTVTLKSEILYELPEGEHSVTFILPDGEIGTHFTVVPFEKSITPLIVWIAIFAALIVFGALALVIRAVRRKKA